MARKAALKNLEKEAEVIDLESEVAAAPSEETGDAAAAAKPARKKKEAEPPKKKLSALGQARAVLTKAFKDDGTDEVLIDESRFTQSFPHIKSGSIVIDFIIGGVPNKFGVQPCPGLPRGRVINLYGAESSGKTTFCLQAAAEVCKAGGTVCYIDWEQAVDVAYAKSLGVPIDDPDSFLLVQPPTFEKGLAILWTMTRAGVDLVVVDSVGSGATKAQWEKKTEEAHETGRVGAKASQWSEFFPKLKAMMNRTNTCVIGISQLRAKINTGPMAAYGEQTSQQGGQAWKFFSELRISLKRIGTEKTTRYDPLTNKNEEAPYGNIVKVKLDKCKVSASQGREATIYIRFGEGIDNVRSIIEIAIARGIIKKSGGWLSWERADGSAIKVQGVVQFREKAKRDKAMFEELNTATLASLAKAMQQSAEQQADEAAAQEDPDDDVIGELDGILSGGAPGENIQTETLTDEE